MTESLQVKMYEVMCKSPKGTIFTNSDFNDIGNSNAIRKSLTRLLDDDKIIRLIDGFYTVPYFSEMLQEYSYPDVDQLARKIADKFSWVICASGNHALNLIGLSTQVPNEYSYVSDGPYRIYEYQNRKIVFKHTSNRNITEYSENLSLMIQAIKALGKNNISSTDIKRLARFCKNNVTENIVTDVKKIPVWIIDVFKEVSEEIDGL